MPTSTRVLVTGGAGFIGSAVCRMLVGAGNSVLNVDRLSYAANLASLDSIAASPLYAFRQANIADAAAIEALLTRFEPTALIHLAAETHVDRSITDPGNFIDANVVGTFRLLEAVRAYLATLAPSARDAFRFVHVSTDEVYGSLGPTGRFHEGTPYHPSSPYAASKAAADHLALAWQRTYGLPVVVSNCSNNFGPFQFPEKLIPLAILNAIERRPIRLYGDGTNIRDWLYVDDHARALVMLCEKGVPGEKYNFGGDAERSNLAVVETICACLDMNFPHNAPHRALITFVADRPGHDYRYAIDSGKVRKQLGWHPHAAFDEQIAQTVQWYVAHPDWWRPLRERYAGGRLGVLERGDGAGGRG
ncbi:MAG: dTDP-glucose 4,6-dehydratase [Proteobacteria bacterium]|nr:dTDP-glucose 4,6-dehydratase [Pseudomonadota bacterium]